MDRYTLNHERCGIDCGARMEMDAGGRYVRASDVRELEAALAKAEEALEEAYQPEGSHFVGDGCACVGCKYRRSRAALAAIKEIKK